MSLQSVFIDEMNKLAAKYKGIEFHSANLSGGADTSVTQPLLKRMLRRRLAVTPTVLERAREGGSRLDSASVRESKMERSSHATAAQFDHVLRNNPSARLGGFAVPGARIAVIGKQPLDGWTKRETIAHEAFHAKHPIIGRSETAARFAGAYKAGKHKSVPGRLWDGAKRTGEYLASPMGQASAERLGLAAIAAGLAGYGAYKYIARRKREKEEAKERAKA